MDDCIFCKIIKGDIPNYTIFEDEKVKVFMDVNPVSDGHCMIVPKEHTENLESIDLELLGHINKVSKDMYKYLTEKLGCKGVTRLQNNGYGQDVKHYHLHMIPRYENDNLKMNHKETSKVEDVFNKLK